MSRKGGYTEAELLAAEWSRNNKAQSQKASFSERPGAQNLHEHSSRKSRRSNDRYGTVENRRYRSRSRSRSQPRSRRSEYGTEWTSRNDDRRSDSRERRSSTHDDSTAIVDEFGRTIEPGRKLARARSRSRSRSRERSRSRSDSRSRRGGAGSRGVQNSWRHDKFDRDASPDRNDRAVLPKDYRPPSPTWVSRAGGVAIMRKKG